MRRRRYAAVAAAVLAGGIVAGGGGTLLSTSTPPRLPPPSVPGAVRTTDRTDICTTPTSTVRPPTSYTNPIKLRLMRLAGDTNGAHWELDHRVPLAVGGAPSSLQNLWLQPIAEAKVKDRLEVRVARDICNGTLTVAQGQAVFLGNWWKAQVP